MRFLFSVAAVAVVPTVLLAQTGRERQAAADAISAQEITRHVSVIADDSMMGRDTPSPELEKTAQYVAQQFKKIGLKSAGDSGGWFQRYQIWPQLDFAHSQVVFAAGEKKTTASFATAARLAGQSGPERSAPARVVLISGEHTVKSLAQSDLRDKIVLYVAQPPKPWSIDSQQNLLGLIQERSTGLVVLSVQDSAEFRGRLRVTQQNHSVRPSREWVVTVRPEAVPGLQDVLTAAGIDLPRLRTDSTPVIRELPSLEISLNLQLDRVTGDTASAPNVVGVVEGADPQLADQYVAFVAHMDHVGITRGRLDSINNGADDNASGTAGLIELAKAFSQLGTRPARSLVFVATSGGAKNLWGSNAFTEPFEILAAFQGMFGGGVIVSGSSAGFSMSSGPNTGFTGSGVSVFVGTDTSTARPGKRISKSDSGNADPDTSAASDHVNIFGARAIAAVNLDRIGSTHGDTVVVDGVDDAQFAAQPAWMMAAHPELRLTVLDGGTAGLPTSDQYAFIQRGVPSLYFHGFHGASDDSASAAHPDSPTAIDPDLTARVARLAFYVGYELANASQAPRWTPQGRRAFLESNGH